MRDYEAFIISFRDKITKANTRNYVLEAEILLNNGHTETLYNPEVIGEAATTGVFVRAIHKGQYTEVSVFAISMVKFRILTPAQSQELGVAPRPIAKPPQGQ